MSLQDLKACRDYVLNLQDDRNICQVRHEGTKKELVLVKDELTIERKRNTELQNEAAQLLVSWSRAQTQHQEHEQQLQEVRAALKRKTFDVETIKQKISEEESTFSIRYQRLVNDIKVNFEKSAEQSSTTNVSRNVETEKVSSLSIGDQEMHKPSPNFSQNQESSKETVQENAVPHYAHNANRTIDPSVQEALNFIQTQMQETFQRTVTSISGLSQGFQHCTIGQLHPEFFNELVLPDQGGGLVAELENIVAALQLDQFQSTGGNVGAYPEQGMDEDDDHSQEDSNI